MAKVESSVQTVRVHLTRKVDSETKAVSTMTFETFPMFSFSSQIIFLEQLMDAVVIPVFYLDDTKRPESIHNLLIFR